MGKIVQLNENLANKIAAGEVVERPASVVKELLENAIDAHSSRIEIEIEEAGLSKIRIIDNGEGIERDDCLTAFERHATSKIKDENDLFRIRTLGFRGEALPSIASVSKVELKTGTGEGPGTHLIIKAGTIESHQSSNSRKGTDMTVSDLFFNTPARLKYLKTIHTELGNITDVVNRIALANPHISIHLSHNGKKLLATSGNGDLLQVIAAVYGISIAKKMVPLELSSLDFQVSGYIGLPEVTRASRNYISTMINGRFIKNYPLVRAIMDGYHTLLPIGRHPIVILQVQMDPLLVDVNVHPSKLEVRLSKEKELNELITNGIQEVFRKQQLIPDVLKKEKSVKTTEEQQSFRFEHSNPAVHTSSRVVRETNAEGSNVFSNPYTQEKDLLDRALEKMNSEKKNPFMNTDNDTIRDTPVDEKVAVQKTGADTSASIDTNNEYEEVDKGTLSFESEASVDRVPPMYPIGQMHGTYILAQNENGLYIIDQHAAQERIKYEFYREKVGEVASELQDMLIPLTLEYSKAETVIIEENMEELKKVGVFLEPFGSQGYIVRSHPQWFPKDEEKETIEDIIQQVLTMQKADIKKLREDAAITMSCKGSIKANHHLRNDEIFRLLEALRKTTDPFTCPHGRPIIISFSTYEMEKMFKRVM